MRSGLFLERFPWGLMLLLWMLIIFGFSSMAGKPVPEAATLGYFLERKGAHVFEYAVLTVLAFGFFARRFSRASFWLRLGTAGALALMYAATDELHQYFVPYRGARLSDVGIDALGIVLALAAIMVFRQRNKKLPS